MSKKKLKDKSIRKTQKKSKRTRSKPEKEEEKVKKAGLALTRASKVTKNSRWEGLELERDINNNKKKEKLTVVLSE